MRCYSLSFCSSICSLDDTCWWLLEDAGSWGKQGEEGRPPRYCGLVLSVVAFCQVDVFVPRPRPRLPCRRLPAVCQTWKTDFTSGTAAAGIHVFTVVGAGAAPLTSTLVLAHLNSSFGSEIGPSKALCRVGSEDPVLKQQLKQLWWFISCSAGCPRPCQFHFLFCDPSELVSPRLQTGSILCLEVFVVTVCGSRQADQWSVSAGMIWIYFLLLAVLPGLHLVFLYFFKPFKRISFIYTVW